MGIIIVYRVSRFVGFDEHGEVEDFGGVGERADRDTIDAGGGDFGDRVQSDASGGFQKNLACCSLPNFKTSSASSLDFESFTHSFPAYREEFATKHDITKMKNILGLFGCDIAIFLREGLVICENKQKW